MTETVKTNERWYKSENRLFHADKVTIRSTGEVVDISNSLEKLYAYMLNQYRYRKALKQPFAESQERLGTIARIGDPKKKTKLQIDKLIALGLVEITGKMGRCKIYTVIEVDKVAENLDFTYPEWDGEPTYDHEKRLGKSNQQPKNEEKKGDGESDQGGAEQRDGVSNIPGSGNARLSSGADALNERYYADLDTLNHWVEGHDNEGFTAYGAKWGITKTGAITDLIKSHIRKIQSDGYKGSRSAANDELSDADNHYKQQQARRAAEANQVTNAQPAQAWSEDQPF